MAISPNSSTNVSVVSSGLPYQLYDTDMGEQTIDISASTRKFQTSVIIQQDPNKNGILSFLEAVEQETPAPPTRQAPQTMRPRRQQGGY